MLTEDPNNTITLNAGDRLVLERGGARPPVQGQINPAGGEFRIRLFKDGKDAGLVTYKDDKGQDQVVTLNNENATLTLVGDGKNTSIEIPSTVGTNAGDYIPRLNIQTDNPVTVTGGGAFIQASESSQAAMVATTSLNVTGLTKNKDNTFSAREDLLTEDNEKSMLFKLMRDQGTTALKVENGSAGIQFIDKNREGAELFLLNGKEPMNENLARLDALQTATKRTADTAWKANDTATQKKLGTPRSTPQASTNSKSKKDPAAPALSLEERQKVRASGEAIINELAGIRNMRVDSSKGIKLKDLPEFKPLLDDVGKAAKSFSDGAPTADKIKTLDDAIDKLSEQAETLSNRGVRSSLKKELQNLKNSYGDIRELSAPKDKKTGYGGTLPDNVRSAALAAVTPMIRGQTAESRPDGSPDAPITARNPLSTGSDRTV